MARYQRPQLNYVASDVWAAACAAQRINGSYIKEVPINAPEDTQTNRNIVASFLANPSAIADEDRVQGDLVRSYFQGYTFKVLAGKNMSEFDVNAMVISNRNEITEVYDLAVIASLPASYTRAKARDAADRRVRDAVGFIGDVDEKVSANIEVMKCIHSRNWNTYYITGMTKDNQAVFFSYKSDIKIGTSIIVQGRVKAHRDGTVTQLSHTKVF